MLNVLTAVKGLAPALAALSDESLARTCRAYSSELKRFASADEFERDNLMKSGMGAFSESIKGRFGTVWTDQRVVDLTVDEALKFFKGDLNTATFCDPACGDGNFLVTFYRRLVAVSTIQDPVERSLDVLRRIYGVDIIDRMAAAARLRLLLEHVNYLKGFLNVAQVRKTTPAAIAIIGEHIIHGNTLRTAGDTWALAPMEGGLTPQWFRDMKFDMICGNPPYTRYHKKDVSQHLPVPVAYKQKNLALSFWQWCTEHATNVYALNTIASTLNETIGNGAKHIRLNASREIASVLYNDTTKDYSAGLGGSTYTLVMTAHKGSTPEQVYFNGTPIDENSRRLLRNSTFINHVDNIGNITIKHRMLSEQFATHGAVKGGGDTLPHWNRLFACGTRQIAFIYILKQTSDHTQFKLVDDYQQRVTSSRVGQGGTAPVFAISGDEETLKVLWCFLNSTYNLARTLPTVASQMKRDAGRTYKNIRLNNTSVGRILVPDLEYYKSTKPTEYQAVLDFAEEHIRTGDVKSYCAGVDKVINDLLGTTND